MKSKTKTDARAAWRRSLLAAAAPGLLVVLSAGCQRKSQEAAPVDAGTSSAADTDAGTEVAPPAPVVAGDPDVPVNEGVVGTTPLPADYAADTAPPAPVEEERPAAPDPSNVWIPGYWWWSMATHHYVWVAGAWRNPPPDQIWSPGAWIPAPTGRYVWRPGFWGPHGYVPAPPLEVPPPPPRVEVWGPPPGDDFVWGPGYYAWHGAEYGWVPGGWVRRPHPGYGWVPPGYVHTGGRYYFQPGRWDHPPEQRGTVYRPDPNVRPGGRFTPVALPPAVVAAHAAYVSSSIRAAANGATRQPNGGYSMRGNPSWHPGNAQPPGHTPPAQVGNGPHNEPPLATEPHPGNEPPRVGNGPHGNEVPGATGPAPQAGNEHPGTGPHPGNLPHAAATPTATVPPGNAGGGSSGGHGGAPPAPGGPAKQK